MTVIVHQQELDALCAELRKHPFITIDTEFLREKTYYPRLCLIQVASPEGDPVAIDPLEGDFDMAPLYELLADENVVKVFHAARQDLEIFYNLTGQIPAPLFDTQVAAMVCGHGEQIGYGNLVRELTGQQLDKGAQFTDWTRRPLTKKQLSYALDDVTYLREVYLALSSELEAEGRIKWVKEEMEILTSPATYQNPPEEAWRRIKVKTNKPQVLSVLREVAAWREREAQHRDVPRGRVVRDETLVDMAVHAPKSVEDLTHIRNIQKDMARGRLGQEMLVAIRKGLDVKPKDMPVPERKEPLPPELRPALEMLKMLLRIQCSENGVATKLVANSDDLEAIARGEREGISAIKGWRYEVFGSAAIELMNGRLALALENNEIKKLAL